MLLQNTIAPAMESTHENGPDIACAGSGSRQSGHFAEPAVYLAPDQASYIIHSIQPLDGAV
jgi:hypothetical protein